MLQQLVELLIQGSVQIFILYGIYVFNFHIAVWIYHQGASHSLLLPYVVLVNSGLVAVCVLFGYLGTGRRSRNIPCFIAPNTKELTEPYESDEQGNLLYCFKDSCMGAWKPPNTHHCSTCGVCRLDFDHHCSFIANCVSSVNIKAFLALLFLTPLSVMGATYLIIPQMIRDVNMAYAISRQSEWAREQWWGWWGSWIFVGGPLGRFFIGTILGYHLLKSERSCKPGDTALSQPHARMFLVVGFGLCLSVFTLALAVVTLRNTLLGQTTIDTLSKRRSVARYICIPGEQGDAHICTIMANEHPYDLGITNNWLQLRRRPLFGSSNMDDFIWPKLNPAMLRRMQTATMERASQAG